VLGIGCEGILVYACPDEEKVTLQPTVTPRAYFRLVDDLLEGLLAGAADGCMVVVGAFLALILLGALVSLLFEPAFWLLAATAGIVAAALWWGRRGRSEPTIDSRVKGETGHADVRGPGAPDEGLVEGRHR
jgi:hypothetical protein